MINNQDKVLTIDLWDLLKYFWRYKIVVLLVPIITIALVSLYTHFFLVPEYKTSLWIRLPQYSDEQTINTAVNVAQGDVVRTLEKTLSLNGGEVSVGAKRISGTTIIAISFTGNNPPLLKEASDTFEGIIIPKINSFVNETVKKDLLIAELTDDKENNRNVYANKNFNLGSAEVIKQGQIPTAIINQSNSWTWGISCTIGSILLVSAGIVFKYLFDIIKVTKK